MPANPAHAFDLIVIGAGSAGLAAARRSAQLGARTLLIDRAQVGGTCVNRGCVPKKLLGYGAAWSQTMARCLRAADTSRTSVAWADAIARTRAEVARLHEAHFAQLADTGVQWLSGMASLRGRGIVRLQTESGKTTLRARQIVLAAGARPTPLPVPGAELACTSDDVFGWDALPASLVIAGGGVVAVEMASTLAHELNQPLSAISNYLKGSRRLLDGATDEKSVAMCDALDKAADQAMRAGQIIRRLRDFVARGESERRVESITKLVEEASALALVGVKDLGIRVQFQFKPEIDLVLADRVQVQQVLLNLIRNAMDAMESSPTRDLTIGIAPAVGGQVKISVTDSGSGISPDIAEQLFQPFVTTKRQGMGVGLSISRTIVEAHNGRIWAEPNPAGGTIFHFTLAVVNEGDVDDAA